MGTCVAWLRQRHFEGDVNRYISSFGASRACPEFLVCRVQELSTVLTRNVAHQEV